MVYYKTLLLLIAACAAVGGAQQALFEHAGPALAVASPEWTLVLPFHVKGARHNGLFIADQAVYSFVAPKIKYPTGKKATIKIALSNVKLYQSSPGAAAASAGRSKLRLAFSMKIPLPTSEPESRKSMPIASGMSLAFIKNATTTFQSTGAVFTRLPRIRGGTRVKTFGLPPSYTVATVHSGGASVVCDDGHGGGDHGSGCVKCPAGTYGAGLPVGAACRQCTRDLGPAAYSPAAGAASCAACAGGLVANVQGTACVKPLCVPECQNGGECIAHNNCSCKWTGHDGPTCSNPAPVPDFFRVEPQALPVGRAQMLFFQAYFRDAPPNAMVELWQADSNGSPAVRMLLLYDDGAFEHRDDVAGDKVFSNVAAASATASGPMHYAALLVDAEQTQSVVVQAFTLPSEAQIAERFQQHSTHQLELHKATKGVASTAGRSGALQVAAARLKADPAVQAGSVQISTFGVEYATVDGLWFVLHVADMYPAASRSISSTSAAAAQQSASAALSAPALQPDKAVGARSASCGVSKGQVLLLSMCRYKYDSIAGRFTTEVDLDASQLLKTRAMLQDAGYEVTTLCEGQPGLCARAPTLDDLKGWEKYAAVVLQTHGDSEGRGRNARLHTCITEGGSPSTYADWAMGRLVSSEMGWMVTPAFFKAHTAKMSGTVITTTACRSMRPISDGRGLWPQPEFADVFINSLGAGSYSGYTGYVDRAFAIKKTEEIFRYLLAGGAVGQLCENPDEVDPTGAYDCAESAGDCPKVPIKLDRLPKPGAQAAGSARAPRGDAAATLPALCGRALKDYDLRLTYTWSADQQDLDTATLFGDSLAGYLCGDRTSYLTFSGDNTDLGGSETVVVSLYDAHTASDWSDTVYARAGWYSGAGAGPALLTVSLRSKLTGLDAETRQLAISPGFQAGCADAVVAAIKLVRSGTGDDARVTFEVSQPEPAPRAAAPAGATGLHAPAKQTKDAELQKFP